MAERREDFARAMTSSRMTLRFGSGGPDCMDRRRSCEFSMVFLDISTNIHEKFMKIHEKPSKSFKIEGSWLENDVAKRLFLAGWATSAGAGSFLSTFVLPESVEQSQPDPAGSFRKELRKVFQACLSPFRSQRWHLNAFKCI